MNFLRIVLSRIPVQEGDGQRIVPLVLFVLRPVPALLEQLQP